LTVIEFDRIGRGEPLLLIHGTGLDRHAWDPVIGSLARHRQLFVVDLPGHGSSPIPPREIEPTPIGYAAMLSSWLDEQGLDAVELAGNSVGGWTALELAKRGRARSVVAFAPAGLWAKRDPLSAKAQIWMDHQMSRLFSPVVPYVLHSPRGRKLFMSGAFGQPANVPAAAALHMSRAMAKTPGFDDHLRATTRTRFMHGQNITVPVTIVWGERERLIPPRARRTDELPAQTQIVVLPGCGHVPFWDAPELVIKTILAGSPSHQAR